MHMLTIDQEFQGFIEPLEEDEINRLRKSLQDKGFLESLGQIITWNGIIVDGHHRYDLCHHFQIPFSYEEMEFADRDAVKLWIINHQLARRSSNTYKKAKLAFMEKEILAKQAKERQGTRTDLQQKDQNIEEIASSMFKGGDRGPQVRDEIGARIGVSGRTIGKIEKIEREASEEDKQALATGKISVERAYKKITGILSSHKSTGERREVIGKPENGEDPFASPRLKNLASEAPVVESITRLRTMEYAVRYTDGTTGTISRSELLKRDWCKCRSCGGYGVMPEEVKPKKRKK